MPFERKEKVKIICKECGRVVFVKPWRKNQVYCSIDCYNKVKARKLKLLHSINDNAKILIYCQNKLCKKPMLVNKSDKRKYCCKACFYATRRKDYVKKQVLKDLKNQNKTKRDIWKINQL